MQQEKWVRKIQAGDQAAFREFYEAYAGAAIRTASAITRNREMAKDAVQETFIRVYRQIGSYNPELPFDPWFYRILTNECLRLMKKETPLSTIETHENDPSLNGRVLRSVDGPLRSHSSIGRFPSDSAYLEIY